MAHLFGSQFVVKCKQCNNERTTYNDPRLQTTSTYIECKAKCFESHYNWEFVREVKGGEGAPAPAAAAASPQNQENDKENDRNDNSGSDQENINNRGRGSPDNSPNRPKRKEGWGKEEGDDEEEEEKKDDKGCCCATM